MGFRDLVIKYVTFEMSIHPSYRNNISQSHKPSWTIRPHDMDAKYKLDIPGKQLVNGPMKWKIKYSCEAGK